MADERKIVREIIERSWKPKTDPGGVDGSVQPKTPDTTGYDKPPPSKDD